MKTFNAKRFAVILFTVGLVGSFSPFLYDQTAAVLGPALDRWKDRDVIKARVNDYFDAVDKLGCEFEAKQAYTSQDVIARCATLGVEIKGKIVDCEGAEKLPGEALALCLIENKLDTQQARNRLR